MSNVDNFFQSSITDCKDSSLAHKNALVLSWHNFKDSSLAQ